MLDLRPLRFIALVSCLSAFACDSGDDGDGDDDGGGSDNARTDGVLALSGDATAGMTTFTQVCGTSSCHGADGNTPGTPDTERLSEAVPTLGDRAIVNVILNGKEAMPPQTQLDDQQIADVLAYVQATF